MRLVTRMKAMLEKRTQKEMKDLRAVYAKAAAFEKKGMLAEAARSYRFFVSKLPEPTAYFNLGVIAKKMQAFDEAIAHYEKAIALKPDYAEAYANLGGVHNAKLEFEAALACYGKAIAHNPALAEAYYNRGVILQELRRHDEALADYETALALRPDYDLAYLNISVILYELKRKAEAARNYERILKKNPDHMDARWNMGVLKLSEGDYAAGFALYEERLKLQNVDYNKRLQRPYWRGVEQIAGSTLLLKWEQGFGDTIQFCRYARLARQAGANVVLSVQAPLRRLIESLDEEITVIGEDEVPAHYDFHSHLMSLPGAFGTRVETVPFPTKYLSVDPAAIAAWRSRLADFGGVRIGLIWASSFRPDVTCVRRNDANRSVTLDHYRPLLDIPGATFFSLKKGPPAAQLAAAPPGHGILDFTAEFSDFAETGAFIENLDLVITVDTAVAHLAAALGKPVWILVPFVSCWRWLEDRTDTPWYESVRLFRQRARGDWAPVVDAVRQELAAFADRAVALRS